VDKLLGSRCVAICLAHVLLMLTLYSFGLNGYFASILRLRSQSSHAREAAHGTGNSSQSATKIIEIGRGLSTGQLRNLHTATSQRVTWRPGLRKRALNYTSLQYAIAAALDGIPESSALVIGTVAVRTGRVEATRGLPSRSAHI
jgi:hypothetical protein